MVEGKTEKLERAFMSLRHIEDGIDWSAYMRAPESITSNKALGDLTLSGKLPQEMLASAFLLAKIGDPIGARECLKTLQKSGNLMEKPMPLTLT
ncbi:hypothetical protein N9K24_00835 [Amylibacter sp.]|nr:hypothetical protein [Amylibacter sp.]